MAIKRVLTIKLFYAQARRVDCEHCGKPYTWIDGGTETGRAEAGAMLSDDNELRREAFRQVADPLVEAAEKERIGRGRCPHCHQLQQWMFVTRGDAIGGSIVAAVVAAVVLGLVTRWLSSTMTALYVAGGVAGVGLLGALIFGGRLADKPGPQPDDKDVRAKTDAQLQEWIEASRARGEDPFLTWWQSAGHEPPAKAAKVSLGLLDNSGAPLGLGEALTTAACARALSSMDA